MNDNDTAPWNLDDRLAYEHLVRHALLLPGQPAVVLLHAYSWWVRVGGLEGWGGLGWSGGGAGCWRPRCSAKSRNQKACSPGRWRATDLLASNCTVATGVFYKEPEQQLTQLSQVRYAVVPGVPIHSLAAHLARRLDMGPSLTHWLHFPPPPCWPVL